MHYGAIKLCDCSNGPGMRTSLFVSGCTHHCKGCFNEVTWDFNYGNEYTPATEYYILDTVKQKHCDGLSILGGEPMEPANQEAIVNLVKQVHSLGKSVWIYSGYTFEEIMDVKSRVYGPYTTDILLNTDVLVDGPFVESLKDITLRFRGSSNQRLIDVPRSLKERRIVLYEGDKAIGENHRRVL